MGTDLSETEALLIIPFLLYFGRRQWKNALLFLTPLVALGSLVLAYSLYFFANLFGSYTIVPLGVAGDTHFPFLPRLAIGFAGSLVSPSRGLLVYTPWAAFAFWGAARLWKEKSPGWSRPLIVALAAIWLVQVGEKGWWGGRPVDVELEPQRCWHWSDNQLERSWRAGPVPPSLLNEWERVLHPQPGVPQP